MTAAAKKEKVEPPKEEAALPTFTARRVFIPDLQIIGPWLLKRLRDTYPDYSDQELLTWLRGCCMSNIFWFVQTDHAVALAQTMREALARKPSVKEVFVLCDGHPNDETEGAYLYSLMFEWAKEIGASELAVEECTDVPREMIRARLGKLYTNDTMFVPIE